jgi:ribonuclease J
MFKLINPQYIIPIHGEFKMLKQLKENAIQSGFNKDNFLQVVNGQKIQLLNHVATITDQFIDANEVFVEGGKINGDTTGVLKYRTTLSTDGVFNVTMLVDRKQRKILELPVIATRGCFYAKSSAPLITKIQYSIKENVEEAMKKHDFNINNNEIRRIAENTVGFFI